MRDDDNIRHYAPLLRRIIILVAVIVAVPVTLWTITTFMRTYVAPPKVPTFRPLAAAALITTPDAAAADGPATTASLNANYQPSPIIIKAGATTADASASVLGPQAPMLGNRLDSSDRSAPANNASVVLLTPTAASAASPPAGDAIAAQAEATPDPAPSPWPSVAQAPPSPSDQEADAVPAGQPIAGPIPLPHRRPHDFAMAATGIPMPRPRPANVEPDTVPPTSDGPLGWINNIFHQGQQ